MAEATTESNSGKGKQDKVAKMPDVQQMEQKLTEVGLLGISEQSDRVFKRFASSVAGSEKVGAGLAMAWELANYDELKDYPPQVQALMSMYFNKTVDTVTPDPEVAQQAKQFMAEVRNEAKKGR